MCVYCVDLLCIYKYTHMHVYILEKYVYIKYIYICYKSYQINI